MVSAPDTAIRVHLHFLKHFGRVLPDVEQYLDRGGRAVEHAAAVVRDVDGLKSEIQARLGVLPCLDTLGYDGEGRHVANGREGFQVECGCMSRAG